MQPLARPKVSSSFIDTGMLEKLGFAPVRRETIARLDTVFFERQRPPG